jgi:hypothetical protein
MGHKICGAEFISVILDIALRHKLESDSIFANMLDAGVSKRYHEELIIRCLSNNMDERQVLNLCPTRPLPLVSRDKVALPFLFVWWPC